MKYPKTYVYPAVFTYEPGQEIAVTFPDLGEATSGVDEADAFASARELLGLTLYGMERDGEAIPPASSAMSVHREKNETVALIEVYMPSVRYAMNNHSVNRTVTLPAWLNAKAVEQNINFSQVLQEALKERLA